MSKAIIIIVVLFLAVLFSIIVFNYFKTDSRFEVKRLATFPTDVPVSQEEENITINNEETKVMQATIHTTRGDIVLEFFPDLAPKTVENFLKLSRQSFYTGVKFHRVIKGFMIQGGDPLTKDDAQTSKWGTGGPGYKFADEIHAENRNDVGTIAMANAGPDTNGSQFFINVGSNNFLDGKHTVFGKVVSGMDVVKAIEGVPTSGEPSNRPLTAVIITSVTVK